MFSPNLPDLLSHIYDAHLIGAYTYIADLNPGASRQALLVVVDQLPFGVLKKQQSLSKALRKCVSSLKLFTREELLQSLDVFPIEFLDIINDHTLIVGQDCLKSLEVDPAHLRHECEFYLRSTILKLRENFAFADASPKTLITDSLPMVVSISKYYLRLLGKPVPHTAAEAIIELRHVVQFDTKVFLDLLTLKSKVKPAMVFESYLTQLEAISGQLDVLNA